MKSKLRKIQAVYVDRGFGFPVALRNVPMIKIRGSWTPDINYRRLELAVLNQLIELEGRLTGNQVRYIRLHLEMTLQKFAERFGVTHPAVLRWEGAGDHPTGMSWSTEKDIRLFVLVAIEGSSRDFVSLYRRLEHVRPQQVGQIEVDTEKLAA